MKRAIILATVLVASTAHAERESGFGAGVNNPMLWRNSESVGVSLYYRFAPKQVIRINFARYELAGTPVQHAIDMIRGDVRHTGRATDLGVGWTYFPRRAFDGPSLELGAVWRDNDQYPSRGRITRDELARALVGYSYLMHEHLFVAVAAGGSAGRANGTRMDGGEISTWTASFEGYVRLGFVFGN